MNKIAALYVHTDGPYFNLIDVEPFDEARDARKYQGPWPCVAHPPCQRWGNYATGGPNPAAKRRLVGDDGGCFIAALTAVRFYGGVLEHPRASKAWAAYGLTAPPFDGGWIKADEFGGFTCCVEQGNYGHKARKATWLYANGVVLPELRWGSSGKKMRLDLGPRSKEHAKQLRAEMRQPLKRLSHTDRIQTPPVFRDLLISIARTAYWVRHE